MPPGRSTTRPAPAGSTGAPPAPTPTLDRRQQSVGNAAVQERVASQGQTGPGTGGPGGIAAAQGALRDNTHSASVSVSGRLPANAVLGESDGNQLSTGAATGFNVGVGRSGLWARFHPALLARPGGFWQRMATGGITLSSLYFNFQTGRASLSVDTGTMGDFLDLFIDLKAGIEQKFADAVKGVIPEGVRGGGYDPYTDPQLTQKLSSIVTALSSAFPTGAGPATAPDLASRITDPEVSAHVSARAAEMPLSGGMRIKLGDRASIELTARLEGSMKEAMASPRLRELRLDTQGLTLEHETAGLLGGLDLHGITFGPDLSVRTMDYTLGAETALGLLKVLGAVAQLRTGQDLGVRDLERPELRAIRTRVEAEARQRLPQMLRDQVRQIGGDLPGLPLGQLLGPQT